METNILKEILTKTGGDVSTLPDNLLSTHYEAIIRACGGRTDDLPDKLQTTYLKRIAEVVGTGNGGSVEGTAIPVGVQVDKIYFNTNLTKEETNAYLSQLTYMQTDLLPYPFYPIYARTNDGVTGAFVIVVKISEEEYEISIVWDIANAASTVLYGTNRNSAQNGWVNWQEVGALFGCNSVLLFNDNDTVLTDFNGLPIGAENEKIKNVLSITPFGASGGTSTNKPTAYTVSSVDELPSDAVDGSTAIVESDSDILGTWKLNNDLNMADERYYFEFQSNGHLFCGLVMGGGVLTYTTNYDTSPPEGFGGVNPWDSGWDFPQYQTMTIAKIPITNVLSWLSENGERIEAIKSKTLYSRENGEWVYKCEVV